MPSAAHLVAHQFTPERARLARSKATPALKILHANRQLDRSIAKTKTARLHIDGHGVVNLLSDLRARQEQSEQSRRTLDERVARLEKPLGRADYRRAVLERNLGRATVEPQSKSHKHEHAAAPVAPVQSTDEPRMLEPIGFAPRSRKS